LLPEAIAGLGERVYQYWERFADCFTTRTRDTSHYALDYLRGLLRMKADRHFTGIARSSGHAPQNLQHFMSHSPWSAQEVLEQVREEVAATPAFATGGVLVLDESADEKASAQTVGAGRQDNGRLGKVEMSQVGTFLAYVNEGLGCWLDGELFLPEAWFAPGMAKERARLGVPPERCFATKIELGWQMIARAQAEGVPLEWVTGDTLYGRSSWLRGQRDAAKLRYVLDVPCDTQVYLTPPVVGVPVPRAKRRGRRPTRPRVLSVVKPVEVRTVAASPQTVWTQVRVRATARGESNDEFSARRVWTVSDEGQVREEGLLLRRTSEGRVQYALSNAEAEVGLENLAWAKCQRVFIECSNRDAKSEAGWDELQATKYLAWEHHLALTILATWFIAQTKLEWREQYPRDPELQKQLQTEMWPALSMANLRELLRAVMPLPQLTPEYATQLVVEHLVNRTRARKSRMKALDHRHRAIASKLLAFQYLNEVLSIQCGFETLSLKADFCRFLLLKET
jgi:SRSO17 transposase